MTRPKKSTPDTEDEAPQMSLTEVERSLAKLQRIAGRMERQMSASERAHHRAIKLQQERERNLDHVVVTNVIGDLYRRVFDHQETACLPPPVGANPLLYRLKDDAYSTFLRCYAAGLAEEWHGLDDKERSLAGLPPLQARQHVIEKFHTRYRDEYPDLSASVLVVMFNKVETPRSGLAKLGYASLARVIESGLDEANRNVEKIFGELQADMPGSRMAGSVPVNRVMVESCRRFLQNLQETPQVKPPRANLTTEPGILSQCFVDVAMHSLSAAFELASHGYAPPGVQPPLAMAGRVLTEMGIAQDFEPAPGPQPAKSKRISRQDEVPDPANSLLAVTPDALQLREMMRVVDVVELSLQKGVLFARTNDLYEDRITARFNKTKRAPVVLQEPQVNQAYERANNLLNDIIEGMTNDILLMEGENLRTATPQISRISSTPNWHPVAHTLQ